MKTRHALGAVAVVVGAAVAVMAPAPLAAAQAGDAAQVAQARMEAPGSAWGGGEPRHGPTDGYGGGRQHPRRRFSLAGLALHLRQELALTPAQVESLRQLGTDAQRAAIKRRADRELAELDLRTLMMPEAADPDKPRDLDKIEAQVRAIEKLRADGHMAWIRTMEQSRQVLTPEQREKLRTLLAARWPPRGPSGPQMPRPGMRGMAPDGCGDQPAAAEGDSDSDS